LVMGDEEVKLMRAAAHMYEDEENYKRQRVHAPPPHQPQHMRVNAGAGGAGAGASPPPSAARWKCMGMM
jgi:hypothetical protein